MLLEDVDAQGLSLGNEAFNSTPEAVQEHTPLHWITYICLSIIFLYMYHTRTPLRVPFIGTHASAPSVSRCVCLAPPLPLCVSCLLMCVLSVLCLCLDVLYVCAACAV